MAKVHELRISGENLPCNLSGYDIMLKWRISRKETFRDNTGSLKDWEQQIRSEVASFVQNCEMEYTRRNAAWKVDICSNLWFDKNYTRMIDEFGVVLVELATIQVDSEIEAS